MIIDNHVVVDTYSARYVWEHAYYPRYYVPVGDFDVTALLDENRSQALALGSARIFGLTVGEHRLSSCVAVFDDGAVAGLARIDPDLGQARWFEEDEQIFVHPRNPYARVDAVRSSRHVRILLNGVLLAESNCPTIIFETGLPPRYYLPRSAVDFTTLTASDTVTSCPYKGTTSEYWSAEGVADIAWVYDFPTREALPIAGLVAFYDEKVDVVVDGVQTRPPRG